MYDLFVIAYDDSVWGDFKERYPHAKRVDPTDRVILECAIQSYTSMFWLVDYEFMIDPDWDFKYTVPIWDRNYIHTWAGFDPLTNEPTGQYPIKLVPKNLIITTESPIDELFESIGLF